MAMNVAKPPELPRPGERIGLYLDLGKKATGWAVLQGKDVLCASGLWSFADAPCHGQLARDLYGRLGWLLLTSQPHLAAYEAAHHQRGAAAEVFGVLSTALKLACYDNGVPLYKVASGQIKRIVAGDGAGDKAVVVAGVNAALDLDLDPSPKSADHNRADAIGVGLAAYRLALTGELKAAA